MILQNMGILPNGTNTNTTPKMELLPPYLALSKDLGREERDFRKTNKTFLLVRDSHQPFVMPGRVEDAIDIDLLLLTCFTPAELAAIPTPPPPTLPTFDANTPPHHHYDEGFLPTLNFESLFDQRLDDALVPHPCSPPLLTDDLMLLDTIDMEMFCSTL